jgi:hypothetical protein
MIRTNRGSLLEVALIGEITHPVVEGSYMTAWDGTPMVGMGRGGIVYNVRVGDPCFGWAWGEKVEPGASADGVGNDREKGAFRNLSCIGNRVKVMGGEAKGETGVIVGKRGYITGGGHHVPRPSRGDGPGGGPRRSRRTGHKGDPSRVRGPGLRGEPG